MQKIYLTYFPILAKGGGANVLGIESMSISGNCYLIKDVSVNIKIKLKSLPDSSKSRIQLTYQNKQVA